MQQRNQYELTQQASGPPTFAAKAKTRIMSKHGISEQQWAIYDAAVSIGLLTLRTAFPTQTRNYSDREHDMLTALWLEIFSEVEPGILHEAIMRFVAADRKGFFPAPGQVMGYVEIIRAERERLEKEERMKRHAAEMQIYFKRVESGENCSTCRFCECRKFIHSWDRTQNENRLYCQHPDSYKYEGETGHGTAACIVCDYYEPRGGLLIGTGDG